ncbi:MAG: Nif3-like dinuclear metal center hexameric protein [Clostridiales bacterium]|jgi:putative NIF3 family GTP cyclohydrolase 1 type 2|nr:Nif3-like dinuclear metal center hexameric protein [Clostridiales bacterium]
MNRTLDEINKNLINSFAAEKLSVDGESAIRFNYDRNIKTVAYATNLTPDVINGAAKIGAEILITHHDAWSFIPGFYEECYRLLKKNRINHAFFHLPLDDADFGTAHTLANSLGLIITKSVISQGIYSLGVVAKFKKAQSLAEFQKKAEKLLGEKIRTFKNNDLDVQTVCIVTGAGNDIGNITAAIDERCDLYLTGEYGLYSQLYAKFAQINLMCGSHTKTELLGTKALAERVCKGLNVKIVEVVEPNY